jgi:hypothetical protein
MTPAEQKLGTPQVVVDTSVLRQVKGNLARGDWPVLRAAGRLGLLAFRVPAVVLQELVDHHRRDLLQIAELERKLERLRSDVLDRPDEDSAPQRSERRLDEGSITRQCSGYADDVRAWFDEVGSVLDDPAVPHRELVDRILARRRPFAGGEAGYRDALIWYSSLECATSAPVILLTANTKDFATEDDGVYKLADDLVADLATNGLPPECITLLTSTSELLQAVLPEWDDQGVRAAWLAFLTSDGGARAIDQRLNERLGCELAAPPADAPPWLWSIGVRSVTTVTSVEELQSVPDSDGWNRVRARVSCRGRIGGYAWSWGDPDAETGNFVVWDDWGGLTAYYASQDETTVGVIVGARFRPVIDVEQFEVSDAYLEPYRGAVDSSDELRRVHRSLSALSDMLTLHGDRPEFLADVLGDCAAEFEMVVSGLVAEWEDVCDRVPGRYTTMTIENLPAVLQDPAGLLALRSDLRRAVEAIRSILASS